MTSKPSKKMKLSIVLPTLNERENVPVMYRQILEAIQEADLDYEIIFIDDDSPDGTIDVIKDLRKKDENVKYLLMSRRFGDQISIMAGLEHATGDVVVTMDSDLQHPPEYIPRMVEKWRQGLDIIVMQREEAGHGSFFKKWSEILFYKILGKLSNTPIYYRFSGFVLMDRRAVDALRRFKESDPFVRGLVGLIGFKKTELPYREVERQYGRSKYHLFDMIKLAITGITSFSDKPLYLSFYIGTAAVLISLCYAVYVLTSTLFFDASVVGWASTILVVIFIGGVQLVSTGISGIFLSKVFIDSKNRPRYFVAEYGGINKPSE